MPHHRREILFSGNASPQKGDTTYSEMMENTFLRNECRKQAGVTVLIPDKICFKPKLERKDKKNHFRLIKGTRHEKDITILKVYVPNTAIEFYFLNPIRCKVII